MREKEIDKLKEYKYGFTTDIENIRSPKGLSKKTIELVEYYEKLKNLDIQIKEDKVTEKKGNKKINKKTHKKKRYFKKN